MWRRGLSRDTYPEFPVDRILEPKFSFRMNVDEGIDDLMYQIFAAGMVMSQSSAGRRRADPDM